MNEIFIRYLMFFQEIYKIFKILPYQLIVDIIPHGLMSLIFLYLEIAWRGALLSFSELYIFICSNGKKSVNLLLNNTNKHLNEFRKMCHKQIFLFYIFHVKLCITIKIKITTYVYMFHTTLHLL